MSSPASPDPELRAARRTLILLVVAVGAVTAVVVMLLLGVLGDDGAPEVDSTLERTDDPVVDGEPVRGRSVAIGPADGEEVGGYLADRREALRGLEGDVTAVVSLTGYSTVSTVEDLHEGLALDSYLIALPGTAPRRTGDVETEVTFLRQDAEQQLAELEELLPTVDDDPEFEAFYRDEIERYRRITETESTDDVVFGFVVTGPAADLRSLGSRASVRLVDAVDDVDPEDAAVAGLRPEERRTVGDPPFRP